LIVDGEGGRCGGGVKKEKQRGGKWRETKGKGKVGGRKRK
jgi:hypothetical protein